MRDLQIRLQFNIIATDCCDGRLQCVVITGVSANLSGLPLGLSLSLVRYPRALSRGLPQGWLGKPSILEVDR